MTTTSRQLVSSLVTMLLVIAWTTAWSLGHDSRLSKNLSTLTRVLQSDPCETSLDALCQQQAGQDDGIAVKNDTEATLATTTTSTSDDTATTVATDEPRDEGFEERGPLPIYGYVLIGCGVLAMSCAGLSMSRRGARRDFPDTTVDFDSMSSYSTESSQPTTA